jgi:hypothetical protein
MYRGYSDPDSDTSESGSSSDASESDSSSYQSGSSSELEASSLDSNDEEEDDDDEEPTEEEKKPTEEELVKLTNAKLKDLLKAKSLKVTGRKAELIDRLLGREMPTVRKKKIPKWVGSKARAGLLRMLKDKKSHVHKKTPAELYESDPAFKDYEYENFKTNLRTLRALAKTQNEIIKMNDHEIWKESIACPRNETTLRGHIHWDTSAAPSLLREDVISGMAEKIKPKALHQSRAEYRVFPLDTFRKHIFQEKRFQREEKGFQHMRNKKGLKNRTKESHAMKKQWEARLVEKDLAEMLESYGNMKAGDGDE